MLCMGKVWNESSRNIDTEHNLRGEVREGEFTRQRRGCKKTRRWSADANWVWEDRGEKTIWTYRKGAISSRRSKSSERRQRTSAAK